MNLTQRQSEMGPTQPQQQGLTRDDDVRMGEAEVEFRSHLAEMSFVRFGLWADCLISLKLDAYKQDKSLFEI